MLFLCLPCAIFHSSQEKHRRHSFKDKYITCKDLHTYKIYWLILIQQSQRLSIPHAQMFQRHLIQKQIKVIVCVCVWWRWCKCLNRQFPSQTVAVPFIQWAAVSLSLSLSSRSSIRLQCCGLLLCVPVIIGQVNVWSCSLYGHRPFLHHRTDKQVIVCTHTVPVFSGGMIDSLHHSLHHGFLLNETDHTCP